MIKPVYIAALLLLVILSCKKESFIEGSNAVVELSADSLHFDTLFTTAGSVTRSFKLFNRNRQKLRISDISVGGGKASSFRINADGFEGPQVKDLEMAADDSLYVFVTVQIDPSSSGLPFIVQDSVKISFNGNQRSVQLEAWGQNANFLRSEVISQNTVWTNNKPYVILGGLRVDTNAVLSIQKGTKVYLHNDAAFLVDGTLRATGEKADSMQVVFTGDRLDNPYNTYPGAWPGIYFRSGSRGNVLKQVIIKNATQGVVVQGPSVDSDPKLVLEECVVENCYDAGLIGTQTSLEAVNCLVSNCGKNIELAGGGSYSMLHCTVAAYSNSLIAHKAPVLTLANFLNEGSGAVVSDLHASFKNCIFWGDNGVVDDEVEVMREGTGVFDADFKNCLWKMTRTLADVTTSGMIENQDPQFLTTDASNNAYDFHLGSGSPALNAGISAGVPVDLDENPRDLNFPDLGAYEATF